MGTHGRQLTHLVIVATLCFRLVPLTNASNQSDPLELELPPYVQYVSPSEAIVRWWTKEPCPSILEYGLAGPGAKFSPRIRLFGKHQGNLDTRREDQEPKTHHAMKIDGLRYNEVYAYRIKISQGQAERATEVYELDTALNYAVRPLPKGIKLTKNAEHMRAIAQKILSQTGITKGYCVVWGLADGQLAYELAAGSELTVVGLDTDPDRIAEVRKRLYQAGVYGGRISIQNIEAFDDVPYPSNFANLIVSERMLQEGDCSGDPMEMTRLLRPRGGAAVLVSKDSTTCIDKWLNQVSVTFQIRQDQTGIFHKITKAALPSIGSWTHQYGDAGNTADSHDELGGATTTDELQIQWLGKPGADFGLDRNPRMPAPLAANGRLFHQGMNRMVALDSYNGTILWSLEIPAMQRVNLPRDASNWCTDEAFLYTAIEDQCWMIEHYHGRLEHVFTLPTEFPARDYDWGYLARQGQTLFASAVRKNTVYTEFWGGDAWYDKTKGPGTEKVCSDALLAFDIQTKAPLWTWRNGVVINTTIAVGEESVFFVESRHDKLKETPTRRLNDSRLWSDQYLVALNPQTGRSRWETPIDTVDGIVVFFLVSRDDSIVITSSAAGKYHLYAFDAQTGQPRWKSEHKWPSDNHGGHMQHPVVLADKVFLEPCGYDLKTGHRITSAMSGREGCATYCGTKYALIHRGQARRVTLWDFNTGQITSWTNLRPSCWLSTVAGEGMVLSPEGGGGCSCGNWLETSLAFAPIITQGR